jgi:hypothetical protein
MIRCFERRDALESLEARAADQLYSCPLPALTVLQHFNGARA